MKGFIAFLLLGFTFSSYANDCREDFISGTSSYREGVKRWNVAIQYVNNARDEFQRSNPDLGIICDNLSDARDEFDISGESFWYCKDAFSSAESTCRGENAVSARKNRLICAKNEEAAKRNVAVMMDYLSQLNCDKDYESTLILESLNPLLYKIEKSFLDLK